ncbi:tetratricopeptide repeat protein [Flavobacterium supellecticarium]|uniref:Tetratricopeptide repeat protein n=1 Tax=Flavobacterium supellecticarium TaxID=2565924 RepID=A0A4S3ZNE7_9FLAO|nr:tetratricopeptide repeat protein [Flavobacterium supellecticarium]THF46955.1 tetratricopeptide repeat protein [Flavobacterium supellecticarium]
MVIFHAYYRYAQMLKAQGKYDEANKQMQKFASMAPNDQRAIAFKQNPNYLPKLNEKAKSFDIKNMDINSDKSDFGAVLTNDNTLYFASARINSGLDATTHTFQWYENDAAGVPQPITGATGATYEVNHPGTFSVIATSIATGCSSLPASVVITQSEPAEVTAYVSNAFTDNQSITASDARQGFGGMDVYVIDLNKGTEATNVGKPVNSEKDDFAFSFNTTKNIGFVSSNRGGVDNIYMAIPVCGVEVVSLVRDAKTGAKLSVLLI